MRRTSTSDGPAAITRILVLAPNWLGDAAMCTPALRALRRRFPDAEITVAARRAVCDLLDGLPHVTRCVTMPPRPALHEMTRLARALRPHARDLAVIFPHSFRAALLARLAGAQLRLGYARGGRTPLLTHPVPPYCEDGHITPVYMAREYLDLLEPLGCQDNDAGLELHADPDAVAKVRLALGDAAPVIGVAPGAAFGPSKRWPVECYAEVMNRLAAEVGARFLVLTGPDEADVRAALTKQTCAPIIDGPFRASGVALLKALISQADLLLCNDTGPRHVAVALKKPVVCIMGPTSPRYTESPWERGCVLRVEVDCGPCQKPTCNTDHRCMTRIDVESVIEAVLAHLPARSGHMT